MSETLKASFLQLPISKVTERVSDGGSSINEMWKLFHGRAELEEKNIIFSLKASHINIHQFEISHSSSAHASGLLKNYYVFSSRDQSAFHENLTEQVVRQLKETKAHTTALVEHHKSLIRHAVKQSGSAQELLEKAKNNFKKAEADLISASEKLDNLRLLEFEEAERHLSEKKKDGVWRDNQRDRGLGSALGSFSMNRMLMSAFESTPAQDHERQKKRFERRCLSVSQCTEDISVRKTLLLESLHDRDQVIGEALKVFQESETIRLTEMKKCLKHFCDLEATALKQKQKHLTELQVAVDLMDSEGDLNLFINNEKTVESTFKYCKALNLLDFDYVTRKRETENTTERNESMIPNKGTETTERTERIERFGSQKSKNNSEKGEKGDKGSKEDLLSTLQADFLIRKEAKSANRNEKFSSRKPADIVVNADNDNSDINGDYVITNNSDYIAHQILEDYSDAKYKDNNCLKKSNSNFNNNRLNDIHTSRNQHKSDSGLSPDCHFSPSSCFSCSNSSPTSPSSAISFPSFSSSSFQPPADSHTSPLAPNSSSSPPLSPISSTSPTFPPNPPHPSIHNTNNTSNTNNPSQQTPSFSLLNDEHLRSSSLLSSTALSSSSALSLKISRLKSSQNKGHAFSPGHVRRPSLEILSSGGGGGSGGNSNNNSSKNVLQGVNDNDINNNNWEAALAEIEASPVTGKAREITSPGIMPAIITGGMTGGVQGGAVRGGLHSQLSSNNDLEGITNNVYSSSNNDKDNTDNTSYVSAKVAIPANIDRIDASSSSSRYTSRSNSYDVKRMQTKEYNYTLDYETRVNEILSIVFDTDDEGSDNANNSSNKNNDNPNGNPNNNQNSTDNHNEKANKKEPDIKFLFDLFSRKEAKIILLQRLDGKRCGSGRLTDEGFSYMTIVMMVFLDCCTVPEDVQSAMRIINMSNTFHRVKENNRVSNTPPPPTSSSDTTGRTLLPTTDPLPDPNSNSNANPDPDHDPDATPATTYLCCEGVLRDHTIWQTEGIWEAALSEGVSAQIRNWALEPVLWDELSAEGLREAVVGVHNIIFGQLATIAFTMREIGLPDSEVKRKVISMCRESELSEEHEHVLLKTLKRNNEKTKTGGLP